MATYTAGSTPQTQRRIVSSTPYVVETSQHEHGISIVVNFAGVCSQEEKDRTNETAAEALSAADNIAREFAHQHDDLGAG